MGRMGLMEIDEFMMMHYRESFDFPPLVRACASLLSTIKKGICGRQLAIWGCGMCGVACTDVLTETGLDVSKYMQIVTFKKRHHSWDGK